MKLCTTHSPLRAFGLLLLLLAMNVPAVEVTIMASTTGATVAKEEGLVSGEFIIRRSEGDVSGDLAVNWVLGGATTATAGVDFETDPPASPITIPAGESSVILRLVPLQDTLREGEEIVSIRLTAGAYNLSGNQTAQMAIADNDVVISMEEFDELAHEDFTTGISPTQDPNANRRGVLRINLDQSMGSVFLLDTVLSPLPNRSATLGTDYTLTYKIGGNGMGSGLGYKVQPRYAYVPQATSIAVIAGTAPIAIGSTVTFSGDPNQYFVVSGANTPQGTITISPGLVEPLSNSTVLTVDGNPTTWRVNKANTLEPIDTTELVLVGGIGGFAVGDTFRIDGQAGVTFVVDQVTSNQLTVPTSSTIEFHAYLGTGGPNGGLVSTLDGEKAITTHFTPDPGLEIQLSIPGTSTKVDFGVTPVSDTVIEASETVSMFIRPSNAFKTSNPVSGIVTITDDDLIVAFNPSASVNATESGADGAFQVVLSGTFPHLVDIPYTLNSAATTATVGVDYQALQALSISPGQSSGTIAVAAIADSIIEAAGETLSLTLLPSIDYRLVSSPGSVADASATITINDFQGTASITPKTGASTGREHPSAPETAAFTVSLVRPAIAMAPEPPVTISYTVSGTATQGSDYAPLTGTVIIPDGEDSAEITITPLDDTTPENNETVTITISAGLGYAVSGTTNTASVTLADDEPVLSISDLSDLVEGDTGVAAFAVTAVVPVPRDIVVDLTYSGTATAGDRTAPTSVTIEAGETTAQVLVDVINDGVAEGDETLIATITDKPAAYSRQVNSDTTTISDLLPTFTLSVDRNGLEGSATHGRFKITSSFAPVQPITVNYGVTGTATAGAAAGGGSDYKTLPLTVAVTTLETFIDVQVFDDAVYDPFETVIITLTDQTPPTFTHAGATPLSATMTIQDAQVGVDSVTSSTPDGSYTLGQTIAIAVTFTEDVTVTGTPILVLETGANDAVATFTNRSPADTLNFTYTVRSTDLNPDLDYQSSTALSISGGTITGGTPSTAARLVLPSPGTSGSLSTAKALAINGGSTDGKPAPGAVGDGSSGGGCGLGSGFAALVALCMLAGLALSVRRVHA